MSLLFEIFCLKNTGFLLSNKNPKKQRQTNQDVLVFINETLSHF